MMLPVLVLLATGLYLLRKDKNSVEIEARQGAGVAARALLVGFVRACTNYDVAAYLSLTNEWPAGTLFFQMTERQELTYPPMVMPKSQDFQWRTALSAGQSNLWAAAERAEYQRQDFSEALRCWGELLAMEMPNGFQEVARFQRAVVLERSGEAQTSAA